MGFKKKKNVIVITIVVVISFILYQLYFFLTISSETTPQKRMIQVVDHTNDIEIKPVTHYYDKFINHNGIFRGVLLTNMPRYRPDSKNEFKCLKSDQRIPFDQVNDDYCDCHDSSDEPSTSACVDGVFYCETQYHSQRTNLLFIPSNKVNDAICDCCDGSDEWSHSPNTKLLTQGNSELRRHYSTKCINIC